MITRFYKSNLLIEWREELGLSQDDVAKELSVTRATINRVENGRSASLDMLYKLADFYRKPISTLLVKNKFAVSS